MEKKNIYPKGIVTFDKNEKAPDFVLGTMVISLNNLFEWCKSNPELLTEYKGEKQLRLSILNGKDGRINLPVDTWKPEKKDDSFKPIQKEQKHFDCIEVKSNPDDLPF